MTQDIIVDTTVSFITDNERNLQLALQVEKAMPVAKKELIKNFFECVEKQLTENVEAEEQWEIRAIDTEVLWIRKTHWGQLKAKEDSDVWWGISFSNEKEGSFINVADISEISGSLRKQIEDEFCKFIGKPDDDKSNEAYMYYSLEDELQDLNGLDFLKKMVNDKEREKITKDLADKLAKLAVAVDEVLSNSE